MRGPRCAPLLLLLLLPPLLLTPPTGDAAVITGVSGLRRTCPPGMRARAAPRGLGRGGVAARGGSRRAGTPAPVALWRSGRGALPQKQRTARDPGRAVEEKGTEACDKDPQCGGGMCCAVSIWVKSIRICTPMGKVGDSCHPLTRKNHFGNGRQERRKRKRRKRKKEVPFFGRRMHHTCPCMPGLACLRTSFNRFICLAR
ncbi:hypothetical protein GH733_003247, partial [Mirounga leonina]